MAALAERSRRGIAVRALAGALIALAAIPAYLAVPPAWRPTAVRLACALVVAVACARAVRTARGAREPQPASALDARPAPAPQPHLDARFLALREDVAVSARSRRYFDVILWPRLVALGGRDLERPAARRRWRRRGPPLRDIEGLVAEIERRA
jgi:hypothetical protein